MFGNVKPNCEAELINFQKNYYLLTKILAPNMRYEVLVNFDMFSTSQKKGPKH